jgi:hypothetical protein
MFDKRNDTNVPDFVNVIRGNIPKNMPGAERFSPDYDGPMPFGRGRFESKEDKKDDK